MTNPPERLGLVAEARAAGTLARVAFRAAPGRATATVGLYLAAGAMSFVYVLVLRALVNSAADGHWQDASTWSIVAGAVIAATAGLGALTLIAREPFMEKTVSAVNADLIRLVAVPPTLELHERAELQDRVERLRGNVWRVPEALVNTLSFVQLLIMLVGSILVVMSVHVLLGLLVVPAVISRRLTSRAVRITVAAEESVTESNRRWSHLYWLCTGAAPAKDLRVFGLGPILKRRQQALRAEIDEVLQAAAFRASAFGALGTLPASLAFVGAVAFAVDLAIDGRATSGDVFLVIAQAGMIRGYLDQLTANLRSLSEGLVTLDRFRWLRGFALGSNLRPAHPAPVPSRLSSGIALRGVSFRYDGRDGDALNEINLDFPAGSTVALVGDNGAGKTTLVKLLAGLYHPTAGVITVDGINLGDLPIDDWRLATTAAFQDYVQWEFVARETIGVGDLRRVDDERAIRNALELTGAAELESELANGLDTPLGHSMQGGTQLSGGQWQKLALARAMMRPTALLVILDEPTAALDPLAEHSLFERYAALARRRTDGAVTIIVSHRFSTVRMADLIVVLDAGRVIEQGSHAELIAAAGTYAELYAIQSAAYARASDTL